MHQEIDHRERHGLKRDGILDIRQSFDYTLPMWEVCAQSSANGHALIYVCADDMQSAITKAEVHARHAGYGFVALSCTRIEPVN